MRFVDKEDALYVDVIATIVECYSIFAKFMNIEHGDSICSGVVFKVGEKLFFRGNRVNS